MTNAKNARKMRVFVAGLSHETSAFSPIPTTRHSFESFDYYRPTGGEADDRCRSLNGYGSFVRKAEAAGFEVYASTYAMAQPSARTKRADYESLRDEILDDLRNQSDVSMALFFLHGAQMAEGYDDCEGDLLSRARNIVGDECFVGALLDLHTNVSELMVSSATALVACWNYPHTDFNERGEHLFDVGLQTLQTGAKPVAHFHRIPMSGLFYTTQPKMAAANQAAQTLQKQSGVLSVSLIHGFTWANTPDTGAGIIAITDGEGIDIDDAMTIVGRQFFDARAESLALRKSVGQVLEAVEEADFGADARPFVVADCCDNPGGGAGSDSTFILEEVLARGLRGYAFGLLWDPAAVSLCNDAGVGANLDIRIGGKTGPEAGQPLDVNARVAGIFDGLSQQGIGYDHAMGRCVVLEAHGNSIILNNVRGQVFSPSCFTDCGVDLQAHRAIVVKSTQHFYDQFNPIARAVFYCETPGALSMTGDPARFDRIRRPIWPFDDISFKEGARL